MSDDTIEVIIGEEHSGSRLDTVLAEMFSDYSRSSLQDSIKQGRVLVDGLVLRPRDLVSGGETVVFKPPADKVHDIKPENIAFTIVDEDDDLLVVNKAAGMVVHPAPGNYNGTLLNALLYYHPPLVSLPRGGIVHRLDKDTSGLMVIAKTHKAYNNLLKQMQARTIARHYFAVVWKLVTTGGTINARIGRHPHNRKQMAVVDNGRTAVTHYRISQHFRSHTALHLSLETGRTHQIRVHLSYIGHPIVGDSLYGGRFRLIAGWAQESLAQLKSFTRQALHARSLSLIHPSHETACHFEVPLPDDIQSLLDLLATEDESNDG